MEQNRFKKRMQNRVQKEMKELQEHGLKPILKDWVISVPICQASINDLKAAHTLICLHKYRTTLFSPIEKEIVLRIARLLLTHTVITLDLNDKWPLRPPVVNVTNLHVSQVGQWAPETRLCEIVVSIKKQAREPDNVNRKHFWGDGISIFVLYDDSSSYSRSTSLSSL